MKQLPTLLTILTLASCTSTDPVVARIRDAAGSSGDITVRSAYALVPFSNSPMSAYLQVENRGSAPDTLVAVRAGEGFPAPSLHGAGMEHLLTLAIGGGAMVALAPGGQHIMFEPPLPAVVRGDSVQLSLTFARAGTVVIQAFVIGYDEVDAVR